MTRALRLVLLAGASFTASASGQVFDDGGDEGMEIVEISPLGFPAPGGYESRFLGYVYDNLSQTFGQTPARWGSVANWRHALEDISFAPGPWANVPSRLMEQITFGVRRAANGPHDCDVLLRFWDKDDVTFAGFLGTGTSMINTNAVPLGELTFQIRGAGAPGGGAVGTQYTSTLTGLPAGGVDVPDDGFFLEISILEAGLPTFLPNDNFRIAIATNSTAPAGGNPATVGSTAVDMGFDANLDGTFIGEPAFSGTTERRSYVLTNATPNRAAGYMVRFRGDIPPPPPPPAIDLGCVADGVTTSNFALPDASVQWFQVCLAGNAQDLDLRFADFDTEGSTADMSLAIFNTDGQVVATDTDGGSFENAQLSFGVGRRAAVGDGQQYDGRSGQLFAGTFYVAVAPAGSTFGDGYTVAPAGFGGSINLNVTTNVNGTPLAPSVTPIINHFDFANAAPGGPIGLPELRPGLSVGTGLRGVLWSTFETTFEAGSGTAFLDLDFGRLCTAGSDPVAYIFDSSGNIVAFNDDDGPNAFPLLSFGVGDGTPRNYGVGDETFTGQNGSLPAGVYYMATALFATQDLQLLVGENARFHVRGTSNSSYNVGADLATGGTPGGPSCDPDINCDGSPDQGDVACMIFAVAGDLACFCQSDPDFNLDGSADQGDVAAIIGVVAGQPCP